MSSENDYRQFAVISSIRVKKPQIKNHKRLILTQQLSGSAFRPCGRI
jgi:hypothetical protein